MQLKNRIFLWLIVAAILPLTVLVLLATTYTERQYQQDLTRDINASLSSLIVEAERRLSFEREMLLGLAATPAVQAYLPTLIAANTHQRSDDFGPQTEQVTRFLESFQSIAPSLTILRLLDQRGNTLIKVRAGERIVPTFEGLADFAYAEDELDDAALIVHLKGLLPEEVGYLQLPQNRDPATGFSRPPLLDSLVPLTTDGITIGYLAATSVGDPMERILNAAIRIHAAELLLIETNPDNRFRDGLLLYSDRGAIHFNDVQGIDVHLPRSHPLMKAVGQQPYGRTEDWRDDSVTYYQEFHPYPNQLITWVVATQLQQKAIGQPFSDIRMGIIAIAFVVLLLSLVIAHFGAKQVTAPICALATSLKAYADGDRSVRVEMGGSQETQQLGLAFNYMAERLENARSERDRAQSMMLKNAKLASIGEMAAGIAHELNNPLNNVLAFAKLIEKGIPEADERLRDDITAIREETLRATHITQGMLDFARQAPDQISQFHTTTWLDDTLALIKPLADKQGLIIEREESDDFTLEGDRNQLQQALINLLQNAIQASGNGQTIKVRLTGDTQNVAASISDQGSGIEQDQLDRIFDPFYTTKSVGEGTGLGLSISLGFVERHGGTLHIQNNSHGGVLAVMTLPRRWQLPHEESSS